MRLKIASRSSDLARWQAKKVGARLKAHYPDIEIEYIFRSSFGDQNLDLPLSQMESRGVFTQDFYQDLTEGKFDLVVHSWKDLPVEEREKTEVIATLERADVRDILLIPKDLWVKARSEGVLNLLTSSPRRQYNLENTLKEMLPNFTGEIRFLPVRGNIPSRVDKMFTENAGLILAKAALDRMLSGGEEFEDVQKNTWEKVRKCSFMVLPLEINPSAPAQGALAIEIARKRDDLRQLLAPINDEVSFRGVELEREILKSHGGGCHQKIGVTHLFKPFGVYHVEKGESEWGIKLERCELLKHSSPMNLRGETKDGVFPLQAQDNSWFDREPLPFNSRSLDGEIVLVARDTDDLPDLQGAAQIWTAGHVTWKKLASKGYWVSGCIEGLGEREMSWIGPLAEGKIPVKLTHEDSSGMLISELKPLAFYRLKAKPKEQSPNLQGKKFFFWMSASSFRRALELYPEEITKGVHACGPGNTFEILSRMELFAEPPQIFLNLEEFHESLRRNGLKF